MGAQWDQFLTNLGTQSAPFGFAPGVDPKTAGMNFIGSMGANMLANVTKNPLEALGASYQQQMADSRDNSRDAMSAKIMMDQVEEKKRERAAEQERQAQMEQAISMLPRNQQAQARLFPEKFFGQQIENQFGGSEAYTLGDGDERYQGGNLIAKNEKAPEGYRPASPAEYKMFNVDPGKSLLMALDGSGPKILGGGDTNINMPIEGFDKELGKGVAGVYVSAMQQGQNAMATKTAAQQLRVLLQGQGGALTGLAAAAAPYLPQGMIPEGTNDVVAAQAIIAGLIPKQRTPGSGTTSDFDAKKYMESLPSIWNQPGANEVVLNTTEAYADYQLAVSDIIANVAADETVTNKSKAIREAVAALPDPFSTWKQYMAQSGMSTTGKSKNGSSLKQKYGLE